MFFMRSIKKPADVMVPGFGAEGLGFKVNGSVQQEKRVQGLQFRGPPKS